MSLGNIITTTIVATVGAIISGIVLIFTNSAAVRQNRAIEREKGTKSYLEQFYLEAVVSLIVYATSLELYLLNRNIPKPFMPVADIAPVPTEAIAKVQILLGERVLPTLIRNINLCMTQSTSTDAASVSLEAVSNLLEVLYQLRADLEVIIETWVRTK